MTDCNHCRLSTVEKFSVGALEIWFHDLICYHNWVLVDLDSFSFVLGLQYNNRQISKCEQCIKISRYNLYLNLKADTFHKLSIQVRITEMVARRQQRATIEGGIPLPMLRCSALANCNCTRVAWGPIVHAPSLHCALWLQPPVNLFVPDLNDNLETFLLFMLYRNNHSLFVRPFRTEHCSEQKAAQIVSQH